MKRVLIALILIFGIQDVYGADFWGNLRIHLEDAGPRGLQFFRCVFCGNDEFAAMTVGHDLGDSSNVSFDFHNRMIGTGGALRLVLHPSPIPPPPGQAYSEWTVVRRESPYQRFNFSAIVTGNGISAGYRFGQEFAPQSHPEDIVWATEDGVTPGTTEYLKFDKDRVGDSQPIAIVNGHLRFDVPMRGGLANTHYIGRGGAGLDINVPLDNMLQFHVGNQSKMAITKDGVFIKSNGQWMKIGD